jgi:hypothetical protein
MCIHVGFYVIIVHAIARKEVSTLTPQMDLSPCTRVYVRGDRWVGHLFEFRPVRSATNLQILIKRSLDLFRLMWWISYVGFQFDIWRVSHLFGSDVSPYLFEKIRKILVVLVCHRHTPAIGYFSKARLLAINGLPWPMTPPPLDGDDTLMPPPLLLLPLWRQQ